MEKKKKRYKYTLPYYVILTDNGFLKQSCEHKNGKTYYSIYADDCYEQYDSWYKDDYNDKKEPWKRCVKTRYFTCGLFKRKTKECAERQVEKLRDGTVKNGKKRFPNPRVIEISIPITEYLKLLIEGPKIDYTIWEW